MTMPHMTGEKLAEKLMQIRSDIPVILCTGFSSIIDERKALGMGIRAFITKPVLKREIAETIRRVLDKS
jgi:FixJ family two-component response regulator